MIDLDIELLKQRLPPEIPRKVIGTDYLCQNCYMRYASEIRNTGGGESSREEFPPSDEVIAEPNETIGAASVSPLKPPTAVRKKLKEAYVKRKQTELEGVVRRKLSAAYETATPDTSNRECSQCIEWIENLREAYTSASSIQEKCKLLPLLPSTLSKQEILVLIPETTIYLVKKLRKLRESVGVGGTLDPYERTKVSKEDQLLALKYFTDDSFDCAIQSPDRKDVVTAVVDGEKVLVSKSYMTRTVNEIYRVPSR